MYKINNRGCGYVENFMNPFELQEVTTDYSVDKPVKSKSDAEKTEELIDYCMVAFSTIQVELENILDVLILHVTDDTSCVNPLHKYLSFFSSELFNARNLLYKIENELKGKLNGHTENIG